MRDIFPHAFQRNFSSSFGASLIINMIPKTQENSEIEEPHKLNVM
jgi:hypothetical protein